MDKNLPRKRFIIVPACTDLNRGDQALVWESASLLFDALGKETDVQIVDYGNTPEERTRQSRQTKKAGYTVIRNLVENPKRAITSNQQDLDLISYFWVGLTALLDFAKQLALVLLPYSTVAKITLRESDKISSFEELKKADGIVVKGGGFIHTYGSLQDPYYLWFNLYYVILALRLQKKVIFFPNSFGPVRGRINRFILRTIINRCTLVYTREMISQKCLEEIGCKNVKCSFDLAYYAEICKSQNIPATLPDNGKPKIGVTVRPYRFPESENPKKSYDDYITSIADFCDTSLDFDIYFIVQVQGPSAHEDDRIAISDVVDRCKRNDLNIIDGDYDYRDLIAIYSQLDYLIGTRFHSVIFSQISRIPSLAVAYGGNKSEGIMTEIGLSDFVIDINRISSKEIIYKFHVLTNSKERTKKELDTLFSRLPDSRNQVTSDLRKVFV